MAEWKKVVVSGSQAELNSLDLKGSSGNLVVEGNSTLGNATTDFTRITGSADISGSLNVVSGSGVFRNRLFVGDNFTGNPGISSTFVVESSGSTFAAKIANGANVVGSTGGGLYLQGGQYQSNPAITHFTYNGSNTFKVDINGDITSLGNLSIAGNTTLGNTTADTTQITGSTDISGSLRIDGTLTVTGDTLQEDLRTTGITRLGDDMSDKTEITGSLNVTGSSIFSGENAKITIDPDSTSAVIDVLDVGGGTLELIKMRDVAGGDQIRIRRNGGQNSLELLDNGGPSVLLDSKNDGFYLNNFAIGASSADASNILSVTGNAKITSHITASGNISASGVAGPSGHVFGLPNNSSANGLGRLTLGGGSSGISMQLLGIANGNGFVMKGATGGTEVAALKVVGGNAGRLVLSDENTARIELSANTDAGSFIQDPLAIGAAAVDTNNTLSVTGNIKATTGITGSYLTNDNILVAGSAGEVESSGVTWDGSTLDVGAGNITSTGNLTIADAKINGDLVVAGTASFENTENLKVTDRFISLASGSTSAGDGGIVIQQASTGLGEVFGFDEANGGRWGLRSSFDPTASVFTPTDFMVTTTKDTSDPSADPTYGGSTGHGNMHVNTSTGDIFIYA